ncbi:MAG: hypothetical protein Q8K85_06790, partial [Hyphomicrobium sp.]|nr:hypothetical protein [Hyphomicrobium sp.]
AELANVIPTAPALARLLAQWRALTDSLWRPPFEVAGLDLHPDISAALTIAAFLIMLGVGSRVSAARSEAPLPPINFRRFWGTDHQTWPSLLALGAVCLIYMLSRTSADDPSPEIFGSERAGAWAFPLTVAAGYLLGEFIGDRAFHVRLIRLMVVLAALVAANFALLALYPPAA